jgi:hypothetical protein
MASRELPTTTRFGFEYNMGYLSFRFRHIFNPVGLNLDACALSGFFGTQKSPGASANGYVAPLS